MVDHDKIDCNKAKNDGTTPLAIACRWDRVNVIKALLSSARYTAVNEKSGGWAGIKGRVTPFEIAAEGGEIETLKILLSYSQGFPFSFLFFFFPYFFLFYKL